MVKKEDICKAVKGYVKDFFFGNLDAKVKHVILSHIVFCNECMSYYSSYANKKNIDYTCTDAAVDLVNVENDLIEAEQEAESINDSEYPENYEKWTSAAVGWNIDQLIYLQVFRDLNNTHDLQRDKGNVDYVPFYKYIIRKAAQKVDMLEKCLKMEDAVKCPQK